jgi:hypothetical protein
VAGRRSVQQFARDSESVPHRPRIQRRERTQRCDAEASQQIDEVGVAHAVDGQWRKEVGRASNRDDTQGVRAGRRSDGGEQPVGDADASIGVNRS